MNKIASICLGFSFLYFAGTGLVYAQNIGINTSGTAPDASAILDLNTGNSGNAGFLPPQVALTATNAAGPITSPHNGLLIYNTATAGTAPHNVVPGYYYWDGSIWINIEDNTPNAPYGFNTQSIVSTANDSTNSTTLTEMIAAGTVSSPTAYMSITFTPVHSIVFLSFSASGTTGYTYTSAIQWVECVIYESNTTPFPVGSGCISEAFQSTGDNISGWNVAINSRAIHVTPGQQATFSIWWKTGGTSATGGHYNYIENNVVKDPQNAHCSLFIND